MTRRGFVRGGLVLGGLLLVAGAAVLAGRWLAHDMSRAEAFRSIPANGQGIAWVACRGTLVAQTPDVGATDPQGFCQRLAEQVCHGPAMPLGPGSGLPQANRFRERFRCLVASAR